MALTEPVGKNCLDKCNRATVHSIMSKRNCIKVGQYTGILSYSRYLGDTGMAVLVLTLYRYTVIGGIL